MTGLTTQGIKTVLHPVSDLTTAKAVYTALLGVAPQADSDYYVGFDTEGQHIGVVPSGGPQGPTPMATSSVCCRTDERRTPLPRSASSRYGATAEP